MRAIFILFVIFLFSCGKSKEIDMKYDNVTSIYNTKGKIERLEKSYSFIVKEPIMPLQLRLYKDYLIVVNAQFPKIYIYNKKNQLLERSFLDMGKASNEVFGGRAVAIDEESGILAINDQHIKRQLYFSLDSIIKGKSSSESYIKSINLPSNSIVQRPFNVGNRFGSVTSYQGDSNAQVTLYDESGANPQSFAPYPNYPKTENDKRWQVYSLASAVGNKKEDKFALFYNNTNLFEIYNTKGELLSRVCGEDMFYPEVEFRDEVIAGVKVSGVSPLPTSRDAFYEAVSVGDEIWVSYSGKEYNGDMNNIFIFNWDGEFVRGYEFDAPVSSFDVDTVGRVIYAKSKYEIDCYKY